MMLSFSRIVIVTAIISLALAVGLAFLQTTTWWAGYDLENCPGCKPIVDWSHEISHTAVTDMEQQTFKDDGVLVLPAAISPDKVLQLADSMDTISDTFMTTVLTKVILKQYAKYEHKLDTRSELVRDWAIHGPLGKWAAQLMGVNEARLYNAEKIYSAGDKIPLGCQTAWHRDTVAAPFPASAKSVTINVYLDDIGADGPHGDALIYIKKSHLDLETPPVVNGTDLYEPSMKVGDIVAHDPGVYHTPSGKGCWNRRSLQFRYVESPTTFQFEPNRFPHGPIPWTFAHALGVAPHTLEEGAALEGPWYPKVYPQPDPTEHVRLEGKPWTILGMLGVAKKAQDIASELGIGNQENCTIDETSGVYSYFGFDGPVTNCKNWEMVDGLPLHKDSQMMLTMKQMIGGGDDEN